MIRKNNTCAFIKRPLRFYLPVKLPGFITVSIIILFISGCSTNPVTQIAPNPDTERAEVTEKSKDIFIFYDGTANNWSSRTNVRRLFEIISVAENPEHLTIYMDGVGSSSTPITGSALGYGMKPRILEGYKFLTRYYRPGYRVFVFGFSRGAFQARALAGMVAYNGIPRIDRDHVFSEADLKRLNSQADSIWKLSKDKYDLSDEEWGKWNSGSLPPFAGEINRILEIETTPIPIEFLGIWDTVPGSSFKEYNLFKECPDGKKGDRYKIQPYPNIGEIAHAVSLDEKRSKFRPVLVHPPIDPARTELHQVWFPGAHADVGGGYSDSNDLAGISLNWMLQLLEKFDLFDGRLPQVYSDPLGLAHWSIGDKPGNTGSKEEHRPVPAGSVFHPSVSERMGNQSVPIRKNKKVVKEKYRGLNWTWLNFECPEKS